jgi:hypothetical protein
VANVSRNWSKCIVEGIRYARWKEKKKGNAPRRLNLQKGKTKRGREEAKEGQPVAPGRGWYCAADVRFCFLSTFGCDSSSVETFPDLLRVPRDEGSVLLRETVT